jgi:hemolysin activation/secretion protein
VRQTLIIVLLTTTTLLVWSLNASAQTRPDAGVILQDSSKDKPAGAPIKSNPLTIDPINSNLSLDNGARIFVTQFTFLGNRLISSAKLNEKLKSQLNKNLSFKQLQDITKIIATEYEQQGWLAKVFLPAQDITSGHVSIQIVESVLGQLKIENNSNRANIKLIKQILDEAVSNSEILNLTKLDRALLIINDLPGSQIVGGFEAGETQGLTNINVLISDLPLISGDISYDNTGSKSTGVDKFSANIVLASPFKLSDQSAAHFSKSDGSQFARIAYSIPVSTNGLRAGLNYSNLSYSAVSSDLIALGVKGSSSTYGIEASYPVFRSQSASAIATTNLDRKEFNNQANNSTSSKYQIDSVSLGLNNQFIDSVFGGGTTALSAGYLLGNLSLGAIDLAEDNKLKSIFQKFKLSFSRQQNINQTLSASLTYSAQYSAQNLDSAEKFYLGGNYGVRAYPTSEGGGAVGQLINVEIKNQLNEQAVVSVFYDWGQVKVNPNNSTNATNVTADPNIFSMQGIGASLNLKFDKNIVLKTSYSHRIGSNPIKNASTGQDSDGSLVLNRLWVSVVKYF